MNECNKRNYDHEGVGTEKNHIQLFPQIFVKSRVNKHFKY